MKLGYACVFDGDFKNNPNYSNYYMNPDEFSFFLYPYIAPEKFLVRSFLTLTRNAPLQTALNYSDHHVLFQEMASLGLASDEAQARQICWDSFKTKPEYNKLMTDFKDFIIKVAKTFSVTNE